jgi:steroid 5-alpha reductase family enzyme
MDTPMLQSTALWGLLAALWLWRQPAGTRWLERLYPLLPLAVAVLDGIWGQRWPWLQTWLQAGLFVWSAITLTWVISLLKRDSSIMDIAYGLLLLALPSWLVWHLALPLQGTTLLVWVCATVGFGRYSVHILIRNLPHGEDPRYTRWRQRHGSGWWWWSYFQVFLLQGVVIWVWCLPLVLGLLSGDAPGLWHGLGAALWLIGFVFEAGGDWQLTRFRHLRSQPTELLDTGLWALTRHPNYFGQTAMWWGYGLMALGHPAGALVLPALLHVGWFMHRGSATSLMERHMMKTKPGYAAYCERVPAFFPRWPRARHNPDGSQP